MKGFIKKILKESLMTNTLGIKVTRPNQVMIVMRGISGGGKSTKAKSLVGEGVIHSTDTLIEEAHDYRLFFEDMAKTNNFANLSRMHSKNFVNAKKSIDEGISPVIIDNTNIKPNEAKSYVEYALKAGLSDSNIMIIDVGTGGLTAEALSERNTHGVPLKKIEQMINSYNSFGPLTLKKILESKDMYPDSNILYSAVILDEQSRTNLISRFKSDIPEAWKIIGHHMTIAFGKPVENKEDLSKTVSLRVTELGISDMAIAVKVEGYQSKNKISHITLAINPDGGKPVMSNDITNWESVAQMKLTGVVTNVTK